MMAMIGFGILALIAVFMIFGGGMLTVFVIGLNGSKFETAIGAAIFMLGVILLNFACRNAPFTIVMGQ